MLEIMPLKASRQGGKMAGSHKCSMNTVNEEGTPLISATSHIATLGLATSKEGEVEHSKLSTMPGGE